jgi:glycosyltransferase involved in cell wall biosynthesis
VDRSWRLVLAGSSGYGSHDILARIAASPAHERISLTGYVSPGELAAWYAKAAIFAFPSLDEGFGMPVLEAMAAGTPVITSNRSALPEVAGEAALLVNPEDADAIGQAMRDLTQSDERRQDLARRGMARARLFPWDKAVIKTWEVYRELLG